tara:strand:+ start:3018 stop:3824 length:807 start_codon:yes stop_codon:yes gene_type:complete
LQNIINKIKWTIKRVIIFINYPLITLNNNFDFDFLNAFYMNKKLIENNQELNNFLDLSSIKKLDFKKETDLSIKNSDHLEKSLNSEYFANLNSFGYGARILKNLKSKDFGYVNSFHLYPANVYVMNEVKNLADKNLIGDGLIVDYPSGIGNLFIYLSKIFNHKNFAGIDNFQQISKEDVKKYQKNMGSEISIDTFENFISKDKKSEVDLVVSIELDLDLIINNILKISPSFLMFETMYVSRHKNIIEMLRKEYEIYTLNDLVIVYKKK